ncbi:MAG: hypothetical protein IPG39_14080 [Bacteroidetes bacterium]|nr:hypothetical protein [Bacteroidota bacterium]
MNTAIRKVTTSGKADHLAILITDNAKYDSSLFSKQELEFINAEIKKKNKLITINQYGRFIFLQLIDTDKDKKYKTLEKIRRAGDSLCSSANKNGIKEITIISDDSKENTLAFAEGILLGNYQFLKYKSSPETNSLAKVNVLSKDIDADSLKDLATVCEAVCKARDLVNEPVASLNATGLAKAFSDMGKDAGFKVTIFDKAKIKNLKMGGLLAVNLGSIDPPTFTIMEYKPKNAVNKKPIVLVGKGVVYDTGGLSLKPTHNQWII